MKQNRLSGQVGIRCEDTSATAGPAWLNQKRDSAVDVICGDGELRGCAEDDVRLGVVEKERVEVCSAPNSNAPTRGLGAGLLF
jgi:hypothetical protein